MSAYGPLDMSFDEFYEKCKEVFEKPRQQKEFVIYCSEEGRKIWEKRIGEQMKYIVSQKDSEAKKLYDKATKINKKKI